MNFDNSSNFNTGSSPLDEPVFVVIGKFRKPHGIRGEIVMTVLTDFPDLVKTGEKIFVGEAYHPYLIKNIRWHGADMLVSLEELPDRTAVEIFRNIMVYMKAGDIPELPEGGFYTHQLVGMEVITDQGQNLGRIKEIIVTGANDVYLVEPVEGKDILIPAIDQVVLDINQDEGKGLIHIIPGLLDI